jgi:hypothetical protein
MISDIKDRVRPGTSYVLTEKMMVSGVLRPKRRKMKLEGVYRHHAVFRTKYGYTVAYTWHDLSQMLPGV